MKEGFDITALETAVGDAIYAAGVSQNVFHNIPRSSTRDLAEYIVVKIRGQVRDRGAIGNCTFSIGVFAKDVSNMKNGRRLSYLERRLRANLPYEIGNIVFQPYSYFVGADSPEDGGYHSRYISINAFIKKS